MERTLKMLQLILRNQLTTREYDQIRAAITHHKMDADELVRTVTAAGFRNDTSQVVEDLRKKLEVL